MDEKALDLLESASPDGNSNAASALWSGMCSGHCKPRLKDEQVESGSGQIYLSDVLLSKFAGLVSLQGEAYNHRTSPCISPGGEEFRLNILGRLPQSLTMATGRYYVSMGLGVEEQHGNPGCVTVKEKGVLFKWVIIAEPPGGKQVIVSVRLF